jgi:hypothetical protein
MLGAQKELSARNRRRGQRVLPEVILGQSWNLGPALMTKVVPESFVKYNLPSPAADEA